MTYTVQFDYAPAYELAISLFAFTQRNSHKALELGSGWVKTLQKELPAALQTALTKEQISLSVDLLIRQCPNERTPEAFLTWLAGLSVGDMHDLLAPWHPTLPSDLGNMRDQAVYLLSEWNEHYFRRVDPAILHGLEQEAVAKRQLISQYTPEELHELATSGIRIQPTEELKEIVLIPQYHSRPYNLSNHYPGLSITSYPVDALVTAPDSPTPTLLRLTRGLADENRLRILHLLAKAPRTFTEIVAEIPLAKSTVHYHLVLLRAAGLIRLNVQGTHSDYSLRTSALHEFSDLLHVYLEEV